jgi:putative addiction module component (TIGR02574 family)
MSSLVNEITSKALCLSAEERAALARQLIASLEDLGDTGVQEAWNAEIEQRVREIRNGKAHGRPAEDILAEIRATYS